MNKNAFHILTLALIVLVNSCSTIQDTAVSAVHSTVYDAIDAVGLVNNSLKQDSSKSAATANSAKTKVTYNDDIFRYTIDTNFERETYDKSDNVQILIVMNSVNGQYPVRYDVDCEGDGEFEYKDLTENHKCIYQKDSGKHQIWLRGEIPAIILCSRRHAVDQCGPNLPKKYRSELCDLPLVYDHSGKAIVSIDSWGNISWKSMYRFAASCEALKDLPKDSPDLSQVRDMSEMFAGTWFNQPIESWDVSNVTNMSGMFDLARFDQPLEKWDVSNVTDMSWMFSYASFNQPLEKWDVSNVTNMSGMFSGTTLFNQPLEKWDVSNVTNMSSMFAVADYNQPLEKWDVSKVTNMRRMFHWNKWFNKPLEAWNVSNVTDMQDMFSQATEFNQPLEKWDVSKVTNMRRMFYQATKFNQPLDKWDVSSVTNMRRMFAGAIKFSYYPESWVIPADKSRDMFHNTKAEVEFRISPLKTK